MPNIISIISSFAVGFAATYFLKGNILLLFSSRSIPLSQMIEQTSREMKLALVVRTDLKMGKGKVAAQCAHAAVSCYEKCLVSGKGEVEQWDRQGQAKVVLATKEEAGLKQLAGEARKAGLVAVVIHDAGHTQVASGTATVVGIGPGPTEIVDEITSQLKTY